MLWVVADARWERPRMRGAALACLSSAPKIWQLPQVTRVKAWV